MRSTIEVYDLNEGRQVPVSRSDIGAKVLKGTEPVKFHSPQGLCMHKESFVVAEPCKHRILRIVGTSVQVLAGGRGPGLLNGHVGDAKFRSPMGVTLNEDTFYVADTFNHCVRVIRDELVTTLAGTGIPGYRDGPVAEAMFSQPQSVLSDRRGVYVADTGNNCLRRIENGEVTTLLHVEHPTSLRFSSDTVLIGHSSGQLQMTQDGHRLASLPYGPNDTDMLANMTFGNNMRSGLVITDKFSRKGVKRIRIIMQENQEEPTESFLEQLRRDVDSHDVCFAVQGRTLTANRCVLSIRSEYFKLLFRHNPAREIIIEDCSHEVFSIFLNYIYTYDIDVHFTDELAHGMLVLADKYQMTDLLSLCVDRLEITLSNCLDWFEKIYYIELAKQKLATFIKANIRQLWVTQNDSFKKFPDLNAILDIVWLGQDDQQGGCNVEAT